MSERAKGTQKKTAKDKHLFKGTGRRPQFHALWHLMTLGVVTDLKYFFSDEWSVVNKDLENNQDHQVKVAIIDTMPAYTHPNLAPAIDKNDIYDFSSWPKKKYGCHIPEDAAPHIAFGAHGTAVAGLIAAKPRDGVKLRRPRKFDGAGAKTGLKDLPDDPTHIGLPYAGINPFARIIPIVVSAAPDPAMLAAALECAADVCADIVVIADSWDRGGSPYSDVGYADLSELPVEYGTPIPPDDDAVSWQRAEDMLRILCTKAFVFCAAGNEPRGELVYPASASAPRSGPWAVGACDSDGVDLTYSPRSETVRDGPGNHRLITTLSSEHPRLDTDSQKLDPWAKLDDGLEFPDWLFKAGWPAQDIVATDVPGSAGYNPSPYDFIPYEHDGNHLEIASLYCRFSGSSAATAIAAGLASLAVALQRAKDCEPSPTPEGERPYPGPQPGKHELFDLDAAKTLIQGGFPRFKQEPEG